MYVSNGFSSKCVFILFISFYCEASSYLPLNKQNITLQVSVANGIIQGREATSNKNTRYYAYEGIPYAQPPLGNLRFRGPIKLSKPWKGVLNATALAQGCLETKLRFLKLEMGGVEDCLYLNVYTPKNLKLSKDGGLLPVVVWIYGGAFVEGDTTLYGPDHLLEKNLVVINFNYRLGAFGFLSTEDKASPGNYGLKDQSEVLAWIKTNIDKFGGDPTKVTISGHSAGSCSVLHHMLSLKSRGLFSRAIAWSGDTTAKWSNQKSPKRIATDLAAILGIETVNTTDMIEKLRKVDATEVQTGQMIIMMLHFVNFIEEGGIFTPTIEPNVPEAFITENHFDMLKKGNFTRVPLIMGTASMETGLFAKIFSLVRPFLLIFDISPNLVPSLVESKSLDKLQIANKIKEKYFKSKSFAGATTYELINLTTDFLYTLPITRTIRAMSAYIPIYFFVSAHSEKAAKQIFESLNFPVDTDLQGTVHGEDIYLIWDYHHKKIPPNSVGIHRIFLEMWRDFAYSGNPTPPTLNKKLGLLWPQISDNKNISYLLIKDNLEEIYYNYKKDIIDFWDELTT